MKNTKRSIIISAILAIMMCASLIVGGTLALFTSTNKVNVVISSANVDVEANVTVAEKWHKDGGATVTGSLYDTGSVEVASGSKQVDVTLNNFVPTDGVKLNIALTNNSTVKVKYRVILAANRESGTELLDALKISMNGKEFRGYTLASEFLALDAETSPEEPVAVTIEFPEDATEGMNMSCSLTIKVEAQQGNAVALNTFEVADGHTVIEEKDGGWYSEVDNATLLEEVKNGAKLSGDLTLTEDVDLDTTLVVADNTSVEITSDKTVSNTVDIWDDTANLWSLVSARGANTTLTINGGDWKTKKDDCYAVDVQDGANVVIKDGNFIGNVTAIYVYEGSLTIEGGFFDIQQLNTNGVQPAYGVLINCYDKNHKNGTANVTIKGGTFVNFNPAENNAEGAGTNFVADGYTVVSETKENGEVWYTVVKVVKDAESFASALTEGGNVAFTENVSLVHTGYDTAESNLFPYITLNKDVTLNLAGKKLTIDESVRETDTGKTSLLMMSVMGGTLTINGDGELNCEAGNNQVYGINVYGGKVVINGGNYYGAMTAIQVQKGSLEINGGFFDMAPTCKAAVPQYAKYVVNCIDSAYMDGTATISIKGGTFVNFDPSADPEGAGTTYVADGYKVVAETQANGDTWYTVVKA